MVTPSMSAGSKWAIFTLLMPLLVQIQKGSSLALQGGTARLEYNPNVLARRAFLCSASTALIIVSNKNAALAKCTDIESCREIGELKMEQDMKENPTIRLDNGVRYKVLRAGTGDKVVTETSTADISFSISGMGRYMYSKGMGFEKVNFGGQMLPDLGLDSLRVKMGNRDVPLGIEQAMLGMKKGERRRIELPPKVGFETSDWKPEPTTRGGKTSITAYQNILAGRGTSQPPFPAQLVWDVEVLRFKDS